MRMRASFYGQISIFRSKKSLPPYWMGKEIKK